MTHKLAVLLFLLSFFVGMFLVGACLAVAKETLGYEELHQGVIVLLVPAISAFLAMLVFYNRQADINEEPLVEKVQAVDLPVNVSAPITPQEAI